MQSAKCFQELKKVHSPASTVSKPKGLPTLEHQLHEQKERDAPFES